MLAPQTGNYISEPEIDPWLSLLVGAIGVVPLVYPRVIRWWRNRKKRPPGE